MRIADWRILSSAWNEPVRRFVLSRVLGNPGAEYAATRHNVGFMVLDRLAAKLGRPGKNRQSGMRYSAKCGDVLLVKPMSFMNRSGDPLPASRSFYKIEPAGDSGRAGRFCAAAGPAAHAARRRTGRSQRTGIDHRPVWDRRDSAAADRHWRRAASKESVDYVLGRFFEEEKPLVKSTIDRAADAVKCAIDKGLVSAMNTFNKIRRQLKNHEESL